MSSGSVQKKDRLNAMEEMKSIEKAVSPILKLWIGS